MPEGKRLIEEWLPIKEIGVESRRENSTGQHPPPNRLHVWWARRPLTASRAAILGALLPAWEGNEESLRQRFPERDAYYAWFRQILGIRGDPVVAQEALRRARESGNRIANPNKHGRAFALSLDENELTTLSEIVTSLSKNAQTKMMDPMAGGGSIPFEAIRMGIDVVASELNPVACAVLKGTLDFPLRFGDELSEHMKKWGNRWGNAAIERVCEYYPGSFDYEEVMTYIWARTVPCPVTGKPVPLSPNWWLRRQGKDSIAVRLHPCEEDMSECRFEIVKGTEAQLVEKYAPDLGTVRRGAGISPWTGDPISGDYIKRVAQEGKMEAQLYALCINRGKGREFRLPTDEDRAAYERACQELTEQWARWMQKGLIPTEEYPETNSDPRPRIYGMERWYKLFSPRQLLSHITYLETLLELAPQMEKDMGKEKADAVRTYLALVLDKCVDYGNRLSSWDATRDKVRNTFDRHDFSFKWSFAEMNMSLRKAGAFPWALSQVTDAYEGLCKLLGARRQLLLAAEGSSHSPVSVLRANATAMEEIPDDSLDAVIVDPPYGNNVMYAELSDFFYVWLKRSVGDIYPEWFNTELTDKRTEAVANPALFRDQKANAQQLATRDYLIKMRRAFREMRRVLKPEGVMVVMFTHRETDMWNALGLALLETGWEIGASWPVHTESEHSLHQARKNAARSTILLFCRPRHVSEEPTYWDLEMAHQIRSRARSEAIGYQQAGVDGVDLYIATYGPVLGVLSAKWPILSDRVEPDTGRPIRLEPEDALRLARQEVFALRREQLLHNKPASWDAVTEWYVLAWDAFKAREFPFDEARKLSIASGIEVAELIQRHRILARKGDTVRFLMPREREGEGRVDPGSRSFGRLVDGMHTALYIYEIDGHRECGRFLEATGFLRGKDFRMLIEALLHAIPRQRVYQRGTPAGFQVVEANTLENMRVSFFPDIEPPAELRTEVVDKPTFEGFDDEEEDND